MQVLGYPWIDLPPPRYMASDTMLSSTWTRQHRPMPIDYLVQPGQYAFDISPARAVQHLFNIHGRKA